MNIRWIYISFGLTIVFGYSCQKLDPKDPFKNDKQDPTDTVKVVPDINTFEGIHARIFVPTCANSGCHDGTFEPDFRNIESSYNTLVLHPIIKNNPQNSFQYRVVPGNPDASQLMARLTYDIDGQSGIMPLIIDQGAEWHTKKDEFISAIRNWILQGAKDMHGQSPSQIDAIPFMLGVMGHVNQINMDRADGGQGALRIPQNDTTLTLYFSLADDKTLPQNFTVNEIRFSNGPDDFTGKPPIALEILSNPINGKGFQIGTVAYTHKVVINPKDYASLGQTIFFRIYVRDSSNPTTEIPSNASVYYIKNYFAFTIIE